MGRGVTSEIDRAAGIEREKLEVTDGLDALL